MTGDEVRKCKCDRVLEDDDKKNCKICKLEVRLAEERRMREKLQSNARHQDAALSNAQDKVKELEYKKNFPCKLHIDERDWNMTKERLDEVLVLIAPLSDIITIKTGRND